MTSVLVVVDIDGVTSPIGGPTGWGDDVTAGSSLGPVQVSPSVIRHLDAWSELPSVTSVWLTDWSATARLRLAPFAGRGWPDLAPGANPTERRTRRTWWKLPALEAHLDGLASRPDPPQSLVWIDDDLRHGARAMACRRRLGRFALEVSLVSPRRDAGLSPSDALRVGEWLKREVDARDVHLVDEPWRSTPVAPCSCNWDGWHCPHCQLVTAPSGDAWSPAHTVGCHARSARVD